jgi:hypothetical protein
MTRLPFLYVKGINIKLWYDRPAEKWVEALPIGNGRLGGMVYGSPMDTC